LDEGWEFKEGSELRDGRMIDEGCELGDKGIGDTVVE
jgi:hypothetical protein